MVELSMARRVLRCKMTCARRCSVFKYRVGFYCPTSSLCLYGRTAIGRRILSFETNWTALRAAGVYASDRNIYVQGQ